MQFQLKGLEVAGCLCHAIGVKIGRVIHFLMVKFSHLRLLQVMAALLSAATLSLLDGPLAKLTPAHSSIRDHLISKNIIKKINLLQV